MKRSHLLTLCCFGLLATACRSAQTGDVVKSTYIHKYGVPVTQEEWNRQGKDGKVVQLHKDGVTTSKGYAGGALHGECTYSFPNTSTLAKIEIYENGSLVSRKTNFPSGIPQTEESFEKELIASRNVWFEDGTPQIVESYSQGLLTSGEYRSPINNIEARVKGGEGTRIVRSSEGVLLAKESIEGGRRAERVDYYPSGDPQAITPYQNDHIHGTRLTFAPGGLPNTVEQWAYDLQEGITTVYQNGEKVAEVPYLHGKREGVEKKFRDGTILVEEMTWKNDRPHGIRTIYVDGARQTDYFHQGEIVSRPTYERLNPPRSV
ncbi:MAG: toxin-antitoxin system YwqK family antitoxin [Chlamydiales bacterium]|nr:toxin-antitoxin system YwqK family antitoxin [Chlamydiales bacterium]